MDNSSNIHVELSTIYRYKLTFLSLCEPHKKRVIVTVTHFISNSFRKPFQRHCVPTSGNHFKTDPWHSNGFLAYRSTVFSCNVTVTTRSVQLLTLESNCQINLSDGIINSLANESKHSHHSTIPDLYSCGISSKVTALTAKLAPAQHDVSYDLARCYVVNH
jgi:hypothetical protein